MIVLDYNGTVSSLRTPKNPPQVTIDAGLNIRVAIDGTVYSYIKTPVKYTHLITVDMFKCPGQDKLDFINFLEVSAGKPFDFVDQNGVAWRVRLIDDPVVLTNAVKSSDEVSFQLTGT